MSYMFNTESPQDEKILIDRINNIIQTLANFPAKEEIAVLELDINLAMIISRLADIGSAPVTIILGNEIRFLTHDSLVQGAKTVNLRMSRKIANDLAIWIHVGLHRHEAGINYPDDVIVH